MGAPGRVRLASASLISGRRGRPAALAAAFRPQAAPRNRAPQRQALAPCVGDLQHPARAAGDLGDRLVPEAVHDLVERRLHRRQGRELLDEGVAPGRGLLAYGGVAVVVEHGPRHDVALVVGEGLLELHRKGVGQELDDGLARGEVDGEVVPLRCRDLGDAPFHQRLAGRDELDHGGAAGIEIGLDRADEAGTLHGGQQVAEEALLRALEGGQRGGLGVLVERRLAIDDAGGLQRLVDVVVDDLEGAGIGVVDAPLLGTERVLQDLDLDPVIGEGAGLVEAEGLQVAREHLHGRHPARLHRGDEFGAGLEGSLAGGPEPEPAGIGEARDGGGAGRRDVRDGRVRQRVLKPQSGAALLGRFHLAAIALGACGVRHRVRLVEDDDALVGVAVVLVEDWVHYAFLLTLFSFCTWRCIFPHLSYICYNLVSSQNQ